MYYRALLEQASESIILINGQKKVIDMNQTAADLFSPFFSTIINKHFFNQVVQLSDTDSLPKKEGVNFFEGRLRGKQTKDTPVYVEGSYKHVLDNQSLVIMRDITQKKVEEQKKIDFLDTVHHELRTPLTVLRSYLYLLHQRITDDEQREYSTKALSAVHKMDMLFMHFSTLLLPQRNTVDLTVTAFSLHELIADVMHSTELFYPARRIITHYDRDVTIQGDREKLFFVFLNIIMNALKYSDKTSSISIRTSLLRNEVKIYIYDHGIGVPRQELSQLFTKFFKSSITPEHAAGIGIGLYTVRQIVEKHNGTIEIDSEEGKGTVCTVTLPMTLTLPPEW
jgi:signal transduction histidine kinase